MTTLRELHRLARERLRQAGVDTPDLDARLLVEHATGTTQTDRIARHDMAVDAESLRAAEAALARRAAGEPVHRILGYREFHGLELRLSPATLEPRPDTETLVDAVLPFLRDLAAAGRGPRILDLGTGTGAIALALLKEVPEATALGVDISGEALATAAANARRLGLEPRFAARRSDWFSAVAEKFHAILTNPPYIRSEAIGLLPREVRDFDPMPALDGGTDGLDAYRVIAKGAAERLEAGGLVAAEIGHDQADDVKLLFGSAGFRLRRTAADLSGHPRVLVFSGA